MDILNFISWIAGKKRVVTSVPDNALIPVGIRTETRDDKYTTVAIKKSDLITTPEPAYKVYTALLTQSGGDAEFRKDTGLLIIGRTYYINYNSPGMDFTNVGAPNNNLGTYFVATGTTPNSWGGNEAFGPILLYNTGAPVVTVLENTIGNIWFTYEGVGRYNLNTNGLFTINKTSVINGDGINDGDTSEPGIVKTHCIPENVVNIWSFNSNNSQPLSLDYCNNILNNTPIEIRVYN
jgi:hypothetical protein